MKKSLSIDLIITDAGTQMRFGTRLETVKEYHALLTAKENDKRWPFDDALVVFTSKKDVYWLADGFHRFEAAQMAKRGSVACDVRKGSLEDAQDYALGANARHGLRRSNQDKRHAVEMALSMDRWKNKSNRMVAEACGVGHPMVGKIRKELAQVESDSTSNSEKPGKTDKKRIGKDGKKQSATKSKRAKTAHQREPGDESEPDGEAPLVSADTASLVHDDLDRPVPEGLREAHSAVLAFEIQAKQLLGVLREVRKIEKMPGGKYLNLSEFDSQIKAARKQLQDAGYLTDCPTCKGKGKCKGCDGLRWIPRWRKGSLSDAEKGWLGI